MKKMLRSVFVLSCSFCLLTLAGCPKADQGSAPPTSGDTPVVQPGVTTAEGYVEPLVPADGNKEEAPKKEEKAEEKAPEGAFLPFLAPAEVYGKVAAEAVPMPPLDDLVAQVDEYVEKLGKNLEDMDGTANYKNDADTIVRDASGLALVALALGKAEGDSKYKKAAPGIIKAAAALVKVENYADAKKAYDELKAALTSEGDPASLEWTKVVALKPVMLAVPNLDSTVKRLTNTEKKLKQQLTRNPGRVYGGTAAMAAIGQGSIVNVDETEKPDAKAEWETECKRFRDAAIKANAAAHGFSDGKIKYAEYEAVYAELAKTCDACHAIFQPSQVGKASE